MRLGLIGCGIIGAQRAQAIAKIPGFRLVAVADADAARARAVADDFRAAVEAEWRGLVRRDDVDAVIVSTPPPLHAPMCVEALEAGKHVLCEKPLARSPEEGRAIVERRSGQAALGYRLQLPVLPGRRQGAKILDSGLIGDSTTSKLLGIPAEAVQPSWVHDVSVMGGALVDSGTHHRPDAVLSWRWARSGLRHRHVWGSRAARNAFASCGAVEGGVLRELEQWRGYRWAIDICRTRLRTRLHRPCSPRPSG
jgi:predicted dehydrogenase